MRELCRVTVGHPYTRHYWKVTDLQIFSFTLTVDIYVNFHRCRLAAQFSQQELGSGESMDEEEVFTS